VRHTAKEFRGFMPAHIKKGRPQATLIH